MADTTIGWADKVWNPLVGCSRVSPGCTQCYAENEAYHLGEKMRQVKYAGLTKLVGGDPRWTGEVRLWEPILHQPTQWKKPRRIFVNSMSDLFHESVPDLWIDKIFAVMAQASWHTFQVLTKRAARMREYCAGMAALSPQSRTLRLSRAMYRGHPAETLVSSSANESFIGALEWPRPNVWLCVSAEDQAAADERIPLLLGTPAAIRGVSYEPALGPVDFRRWLKPHWYGTGEMFSERPTVPALDWVIVGGESGSAARPFDIEWARRTVDQCREAGVACFVKQLGSGMSMHTDRGRGRHVRDGDRMLIIESHKGTDPDEWPQEIRVQEFPLG
jgi:protein gp37